MIRNPFSLPYKVYSALVTQQGINAPTSIVLENTLGGVPVWSYTNVGRYTLTLAGVFTVGKTFLLIGPLFLEPSSGAVPFLFTQTLNLNSIDIIQLDNSPLSGFPQTDGDADRFMNNTALEIRVYP